MDKLKQSSFEQKMHDLENDLSNIFQDANDMEKNQQRANIKQLLNEWQEKKERDHFTNEVSPKIVDLMEKEALKRSFNRTAVNSIVGTARETVSKPFREKDHLIDRCM